MRGFGKKARQMIAVVMPPIGDCGWCKKAVNRDSDWIRHCGRSEHTACHGKRLVMLFDMEIQMNRDLAAMRFRAMDPQATGHRMPEQKLS